MDQTVAVRNNNKGLIFLNALLDFRRMRKKEEMMMMTTMGFLSLMATSQTMKVLRNKRYNFGFHYVIVFHFDGGMNVNMAEILQESGDPEKLKLHQKLKAREWDELMSTKKKMKVLEPVVRFCVWEGEGPGLQLFQPYALCRVEPLPKAASSPSQEELTQRCRRGEQCKCEQRAFDKGAF